MMRSVKLLSKERKLMAKKPSKEIIKLQNKTGVSKQVAIEMLKKKETMNETRI